LFQGLVARIPIGKVATGTIHSERAEAIRSLGRVREENSDQHSVSFPGDRTEGN
jgi:hypothetical protein